jgi:transposase
MRTILSRPHLHELAVSSGFCQRNSKLKPEVFFDMLFYTVAHKEEESLSYMVSLLQSDYGVTLNKQSLNERFNEKSETYVKAVLCEVLRAQLSSLYSTELLPDFSRILIKDSTKFMVPSCLESEYKSSGGNAGHKRSNASISIQYEYDLKSGQPTDLTLNSGDRNDRTDAGETATDMRKNDLIIRDLGYFSTPALKSCMEQEAFFLSRLDSSTNVYDQAHNLISFKEVYNSMQKMGMIEKEMFVYVGSQTKLPARLLLQLVPQEVYEKRIRDKTRKSKGQGRGQLTEETKIRSRFSLFITNAQASQLSSKQVFLLYRLRWQIELQFKIWKSIFKIDGFKEVKEHRYFTTLYMKLLLIMINLQITYSLQQSFVQPDKHEISMLSLNKALKTLKTLFDKIFSMFRQTCNKAKEIAQYIQNRLYQNHWLESKNKKLCFPEILQLIICESQK